MKKKLVAFMLVVSMMAALTACNSDADADNQSEGTSEAATLGVVSTKDYDPDEYVTIQDYEGVEVTVDVVNYTDADVEKQMQEELEYYVDEYDFYDYIVSDKTDVEEGDIVNIDYTGKKDGVAFEGGTATGAHLEIGSGSFIDGFESGLVGHKVGETVSLDLTFPEDYDNEELAGAAVVFEVKINSIDTRSMPEFTDELIANFGIGFDTIAAYKEDVVTYLSDTCEETNVSNRETAVWDAVYAKCTVSEPPAELVEDSLNRAKANAEMYAQYYGVEYSEFIEMYMGVTMEEYETESQTAAVESAKEKLAVAAIAKKAGIELSDEDVKASAEEEYESYGYESADAMLQEVGEGSYYDYVLTQKVYEYLAEHVTIKENEPVSILADMEEDIVVEEGEAAEDIEVEQIEAEDVEMEEDAVEDFILQ